MKTEIKPVPRGCATNLKEVAAKVKAAGSHYFDRETLRFFGQTMKSFKLYWYGEDSDYLVIAKSYWTDWENHGQRRFMGYSVALFTQAGEPKRFSHDSFTAEWCEKNNISSQSDLVKYLAEHFDEVQS